MPGAVAEPLEPRTGSDLGDRGLDALKSTSVAQAGRGEAFARVGELLNLGKVVGFRHGIPAIGNQLRIGLTRRVSIF